MAASELLITNGSTPATPASGKSKLFTNSSKGLDTVDDGGIVRVYHNNQDAATFVAGTTAIAPYTMTSGTNLTSAAAGACEYDGTNFYQTIDTTSGRGAVDVQQIFRLTANGSAIGNAIADYFGANSAFPTVLNGVYELTFYCYFLKTTAGTLTWTITNTQTYTNIVANYQQTVITGIAATGALNGAGIVTTTTAAAALPVTGTLSDATNHYAIIRAVAECGTAGNIRLRATESAGTITPLRGSYYTARRLFAGNVGTFVA
jgi:hypothetical protein